MPGQTEAPPQRHLLTVCSHPQSPCFIWETCVGRQDKYISVIFEAISSKSLRSRSTGAICYKKNEKAAVCLPARHSCRWGHNHLLGEGFEPLQQIPYSARRVLGRLSDPKTRLFLFHPWSTATPQPFKASTVNCAVALFTSTQEIFAQHFLGGFMRQALRQASGTQ